MSVLSSPPKLGGVRGGLNRRKLRRFIRRKLRRFIRRKLRRFIRRKLRHIIPLFRPPLAPPDSGGETITVCLSMSKSTAKPRCRSLTVQRF
ncbi:MAG: hypothetical protein IKH35_12355 [Prevotella sp.]|nr:hypothetical protein [Prevotella sp.]